MLVRKEICFATSCQQFFYAVVSSQKFVLTTIERGLFAKVEKYCKARVSSELRIFVYLSYSTACRLNFFTIDTIFVILIHFYFDL